MRGIKRRRKRVAGHGKVKVNPGTPPEGHLTTIGELEEAWKGLPKNTVLEIHVDGCECNPPSDYAIGRHGVVMGTGLNGEPFWFNIEAGEFITNCG